MLVKLSKSMLTTIPALEQTLSLMMLILIVNELLETITRQTNIGVKPVFSMLERSLIDYSDD